MKIKVKERTYVEKEIEVKLPYFRLNDLSDWDRRSEIYTMITNTDYVVIHIHANRNEKVEIELEHDSFDSLEGSGYETYLDNDKISMWTSVEEITEERFMKAYNEYVEFHEVMTNVVDSIK